ncbi:helix-turn-helix domain-containing protein [Microvirga mediterraneensis]|uniref:Crp/Fnr family transcriptional regulator n=1 Tax=Microvirga mediterraneensis TaxID=2754695 RepID=A0A838BUM1_9HYPH|nr:Crp/Fnr family transcriptional regulator [Microvirga mediterraneensis]
MPSQDSRAFAGGGHTANLLLAALPENVLEALTEQASIISLSRGRVLQELGEPVREALFPHGSVIALVSPMSDQKVVETATVGAEGYLGFWAVLGDDQRALCRAVVHSSGTATRVSIDGLLRLSRTHPILNDLLLRFSKVLLKQSIQSAACSSVHTLEARCARCLLEAHDRTGSGASIMLSRTLLAAMLGVRRQSLAAVIRSFEAHGIVRLDSSSVIVLDRARLEALSCRCYGVLRETYQTILPLP